MVDIQKNYFETINKIVNGNFDDYLEFLKFASSGNIYNYDFANQIRIFQNKPEAKLVVPYEIWRSVGRSPKFKTGIHIDLVDDFVGELYKSIDSKFNGCVFAFEDTIGNSFNYKINDTLSSEELDYVAKNLNKGVDSYRDFYSSINSLTQTSVRDIILPDTNSQIFEFVCAATLYSIYNKFGLYYAFPQKSIDTYNELSVDDRRNLLEFSQSYIQKISRKSIKYINYYVNEFRKEGIEHERINTTSIQNFTDERRTGNEIPDARRESNRTNDGDGYNTQNRSDGSGSSRLSEGNNSSIIQDVVEHREDVSIRSEKSSGSKRTENNNRESAESGILQEESRSRVEGTVSGKRESPTNSNGNSEIRSTVQTSEDDGQLSFNFGGNEDNLIDEINNELENSFDANISNKYTYIQPKIEEVPKQYLTDILLRGSGFVGGKQRIFDFYNKKQMSNVERAAAIKKEYGLGGCGIPLDGYGWHGYDSFRNGLTIKWRDSEGEKEGHVSWNVVESNIRNLIMTGKYHLVSSSEVNADITGINNVEANQLLAHAANRICTRILLFDVLNDNTLLPTEKVNGLLSLDKWLFCDYDKPLIKTSVDIENNVIKLSYPAPLASISSYELSFDDMLSGLNNILKSDKYITIIENTKNNSTKDEVDLNNSGTLEDSIKILCVNSDVFNGYRTIIKDLLSKYNISNKDKINYIKEITSNKTAFGVNKYGLIEFKFLSESINVNYKNSSYNRLNASLNYDDLITSFPAFFNMDGFLDINSSVLDQADNISSDLEQVDKYFNYLKSINYINDEDIVGSIKVDDNIEIENTIFNVTEVTDSDIKMMDLSLLYPITRVESKENIKWMLDTGNASLIVDGDVKNIVDEDISVTEKPVAEQETVKEKGEAVNFSYGDDWKPNIGSDNERYNKNIEAIKVLKSIESENRYATADEQRILSMYVGWGGLSNCFDKDKNLEKYNELSELLTEEEFKSARASTTDAFYTPKEVIDAVYDSLNRMGFTGGNVLEPSCGIGNFISDMPLNMREKSNIYAVELDSISGRIAKLLHPDANIQVSGFENVSFDDNVFDVVIGNIPFGDYKVSDARYNKNNFLIHDYFIAKCLDKVATGGIVALVTSKGTLDKANSKVRKYIAERADLLGAIRLPSDTFKASANTEATSDILFFQKREYPVVVNEDINWIGLGYTDDEVVVNQYFLDNPVMCLGRMVKDTQRFGADSAITSCINDNKDVGLNIKLKAAVNELPSNVFKAATLSDIEDVKDNSSEVLCIPADPSVKNNTYTLVDGEVYLRVNSMMQLQKGELNNVAYERVKGLCNIRSVFHKYMDDQLNQEADSVIKADQAELNDVYDAYVRKYGFINSYANNLAFSDDVEYPLLCSLEKATDDKDVFEKADTFYKQTIRPNTKVEEVNNATDALLVCLNEYNSVDIEKILELYNVPFEQLVNELKGQIFRNPERVIDDEPYSGWESAEEYLSGNVRDKLKVAETANEYNPIFSDNIEALTNVIPKDLEPSEINVGFGMSWIDVEDYEEFIYDTLEINDYYSRKNINISFEHRSHSYNISKKSNVNYNEIAVIKYGTKRMNALEIIENLLNLKQIEVKDRVEEDGKVRYVLNAKETLLAREKGDILKEKFRSWFWNDSQRYEKYIRLYNDKFNNTVLREYDGRYMTFPGMNSMINLMDYQKSAVARVLRNGNTLLAHCVGAGKSFEMSAACMELRRLGLANKPLIVVPNHLTNQMASEFMTLYPNANILLTTKKDFEKSRRRRFISKIATGDYDAVIIGASQFERIPISKERLEEYLRKEIDDCVASIEALRDENGEKWTIKQMERKVKQLEFKLKNLVNEKIKDDVITFEELGVDALFVDEAHNYKNLDFDTKVRYIQELTPGKNVVFATGTPISNSMCELYTMQKYLQLDRLEELGIEHFDAWSANFGEVVTSMELAPEGQTYRERTRFAKFVNLPELISLYKEFADIQLPDMLDLKIPKLKNNQFTIIESEPDSVTETYMKDICKRAEAIHNHAVDPSEDNMLKICNDGRLLAADTRLINMDNDTYEDSKIMKCVDNIVKKYYESQDILGTQIVFSDIGTPNMKWSVDWEKVWKEKSIKSDRSQFDLYNCIKTELVKRGIPADEICYIHDANSDVQKSKMFDDMNSGKKRIIFGSTGKMGTGTNIQKRCVAMHELDVPWRPSDVEQREGRILRQGNINEEVEIFRYVTKGTFDAYNWNIIVNKQKFISQIMTSKDVTRECNDIDDSVLNYSEVMSIASGNPYIKELNEVEMELKKLTTYKRSYEDNHIAMKVNINKLPNKIEAGIKEVNKVVTDINKRDTYFNNHKDVDDKLIFSITVADKQFTDKEEANKYIQYLVDKLPVGQNFSGEYCGFKYNIYKEVKDFTKSEIFVSIKGERAYTRNLSTDNVRIIHNALVSMNEYKEHLESIVERDKRNYAVIQEEYNKPFEYADRLEKLTARKRELTEILYKKENNLNGEELATNEKEKVAEKSGGLRR